MAITISTKVGWFGRGGGNADADVKKVHALLAGLPAGQGGKPVAGFNPAAGYSAKTDQAIYNFQLHHGLTKDATVDRIGPTIDALNRLSNFTVGRPAPAPAPTGSAPRPLTLTVTSRTMGKGVLMGYEPAQGKPHRGQYETDVYEVILSEPQSGVSESFKAFRFGPNVGNGRSVRAPLITGLRAKAKIGADFGNHYVDGSGGWKIPVRDPNAAFLVHGGTANVMTPAANNGCVMISGTKVDSLHPTSKARHQWFLFRDWVCRMSLGELDYEEDGSLETRISEARAMNIVIELVHDAAIQMRLIDEHFERL